jgi:hypothetical protein
MAYTATHDGSSVTIGHTSTWLKRDIILSVMKEVVLCMFVTCLQSMCQSKDTYSSVVDCHLGCSEMISSDVRLQEKSA